MDDEIKFMLGNNDSGFQLGKSWIVTLGKI